MAFMIPVVKNEYRIYPSQLSRSLPDHQSSFTPQCSRGSSLSESPPKTSAFPRRVSTLSDTSTHKFHKKVISRLRRTFRKESSSSTTPED